MLRTFGLAVAALFTVALAPTASAHYIIGHGHGHHHGVSHQYGHIPHVMHRHSGYHHGHVLNHYGALHSVKAYALNVRAGGSKSHKVIGTLHHGDVVHVLTCNHHNWCKVAYGHGHHHYGWVSGQYLH